VDDVKDRVRRFIATHLCAEGTQMPADGASLLASDAMDSTAVLELASYLQQTFAIAIQDEELTADNLDSVDRIAAFVARKRTAGPVRAVSAVGGP
jgi:acyl carrier protein